MITTQKLIILGLLLCISGYVVWINHQDSLDSYQLANTRETSGLVNTNPDSQSHLKHDKFISLTTKIQKQLSTQQEQLNQQQIAINTLFATLKDKETYSSLQFSDDVSENTSLEMEEENSTKQKEILETAFVNESIDKIWSNVATDEVSETFNQIMPESVDVTQLDCQSTFCKISLEHLAEADLDNLDDFMFKLDWQTSSFIQTTDNEDGSKTTVVYLSRDGYGLPYI